MKTDDGNAQAWIILSICTLLTILSATVLVPRAWDFLTGHIRDGMRQAERERNGPAIGHGGAPPPVRIDTRGSAGSEGTAIGDDDRSAAVDSPSAWITSADYPLEAMRREQEGTVSVTLRFDADGRPTGCAIDASSGVASLDAATCGAMLRRGRISPASGMPHRTITRRVVWRLPD